MSAPRRGNPAKIKESARLWRERNREHLRAYNRAWKAANRDRVRQYDRSYQTRWIAENPDKVRAYRLRGKYGLTADQYRDLLVGQAGRCLICHRVPEKDLRVDHDHGTGRVRGLLCAACNTILGLAHDDPTRLRAAARYAEAA